MIEQILSCLGYHQQARRIRLRQIGNQYAQRHKNEIVWIRSYENIEHLGIAILQRIRRIERDQQKLMATEENLNSPVHPTGEDHCAVLKYSAVLEKELEKLRRIYRINQEELQILESEKPRNGQGIRFREWRAIREVKVYDDKTMLWMDGRAICAQMDGCCGRDCECCEKPLRTYLKPTMEPYEMREVVGVYGHCTSECGCCIQHQGAYTPDWRIEKKIRNLPSGDNVGKDAGGGIDETERGSSVETLTDSL